MAPTATVLSTSELAYLYTSLSLNPPIRPDTRSTTSFRPLIAETDLLPGANGSARLCFADGTEAIVGVKAEVERIGGAREDLDFRGNREHEERGEHEWEDIDMQGDKGKDQWIEVSIDMSGQRDDDPVVVFLAQMIHEGLVADGGLKQRLVISRRWHWRLFVDILLLSPPQTYPLPLLSLTTHLALLSTRLPAPISSDNEDPLFNDDWNASLPLYPSSSKKPNAQTSILRPPITLLVIAVGANIFFDPSHPELAVADTVLAITVGTRGRDEGLTLQSVRTIDPPSRLSSSAAITEQVEEGGEGTWKPRRGGTSRAVLKKMVKLCVERGGVGEEMLAGLEGFT